MNHQMKSGLIRRKPLPRGVTINKRGPLTTLWENFRAKKLVRDKNRDGVIVCQDWKLGLPTCGLESESPDLHHALGREARPDLYFTNSNLVWLVRECHDKAHNRNTPKPSPETSNDPERQVGPTTQRDALLAVQGQPNSVGARPTGRTIYSSVQNRNAGFMGRDEKG